MACMLERAPGGGVDTSRRVVAVTVVVVAAAAVVVATTVFADDDDVVVFADVAAAAAAAAAAAVVIVDAVVLLLLRRLTLPPVRPLLGASWPDGTRHNQSTAGPYSLNTIQRHFLPPRSTILISTSTFDRHEQHHPTTRHHDDGRWRMSWSWCSW